MSLIPDVRRKWHRLWSVRLALLACVLGVAETVLPLFSDFFPAHTFAILSAVVALASAIARLVKQDTLK